MWLSGVSVIDKCFPSPYRSPTSLPVKPNKVSDAEEEETAQPSAENDLLVARLLQEDEDARWAANIAATQRSRSADDWFGFVGEERSRVKLRKKRGGKGTGRFVGTSAQARLQKQAEMLQKQAERTLAAAEIERARVNLEALVVSADAKDTVREEVGYICQFENGVNQLKHANSFNIYFGANKPWLDIGYHTHNAVVTQDLALLEGNSQQAEHELGYDCSSAVRVHTAPAPDTTTQHGYVAETAVLHSRNHFQDFAEEEHLTSFSGFGLWNDSSIVSNQADTGLRMSAATKTEKKFFDSGFDTNQALFDVYPKAKVNKARAAAPETEEEKLARLEAWAEGLGPAELDEQLELLGLGARPVTGMEADNRAGWCDSTEALLVPGLWDKRNQFGMAQKRIWRRHVSAAHIAAHRRRMEYFLGKFPAAFPVNMLGRIGLEDTERVHARWKRAHGRLNNHMVIATRTARRRALQEEKLYLGQLRQLVSAACAHEREAAEEDDGRDTGRAFRSFERREALSFNRDGKATHHQDPVRPAGGRFGVRQRDTTENDTDSMDSDLVSARTCTHAGVCACLLFPLKNVHGAIPPKRVARTRGGLAVSLANGAAQPEALLSFAHQQQYDMPRKAKFGQRMDRFTQDWRCVQRVQRKAEVFVQTTRVALGGVGGKVKSAANFKKQSNVIDLNFEWNTELQSFSQKARALKYSMTRMLEQEGHKPPPPSDWLQARLKAEWIDDPELLVHWDYVNNPVPSKAELREFKPGDGRDEGHEGMTLMRFLGAKQAVEAKLTLSEVIALRLYTGPGYTAINRAARSTKVQGVLCVTMFLIETAIVKLASRETELYDVFRGLKGVMPSAFSQAYWEGRAMDKGAATIADPAFTSATRSLDVAHGGKYGGEVLLVFRCGAPTIELHADGTASGDGWLKGGADVAWISQFPGEEEVLFPRYSEMWYSLAEHGKNWSEELKTAASSKEIYEFTVEYHFNALYNCPNLPGL